MKEKSLLKIALMCGLIGITILFFASGFIKNKEVTDITVIPEDSAVLMKGNIQRITRTNTTTFLTLKTTTYTDIVMFKTNNVPIQKGDLIEIRGKTDKNQDKMQLIADEIRIIG
ncbi:hypothetical protein ACFL96_10915 [Thermoproteota archaeon]